MRRIKQNGVSFADDELRPNAISCPVKAPGMCSEPLGPVLSREAGFKRKSYTFSVPGNPVSLNKLWRHGEGKRFSTAEAQAWKTAIAWAAKEAGLQQEGGNLVHLRWQVFIVYFHRWPRKRLDVDAVTKQAMDALQGILYADDWQVLRQGSEARHDPANPRLEITVTEMEGGR